LITTHVEIFIIHALIFKVGRSVR